MSKTERLEKSTGKSSDINKTQLDIDKALERGIIHRDYLAHQARWAHITQYITKMKNRQDINILDAGCANFPLLRTLYTNKLKPHYYLGVDIRNTDGKQGVEPNFENEFKQTNLAEGAPECKYGNWDVVTCLEVLEHVPKDLGIQILDNIKSIMSADTVLFLSTPCFNGKSAGNHVYEWEYAELKEALDARFTIEKSFGTFASQRDIKPHMTDVELELFDKFKEYYCSNYLSILFAPLYPEYSRNCLWRCKL